MTQTDAILEAAKAEVETMIALRFAWPEYRREELTDRIIGIFRDALTRVIPPGEGLS